MTDTANHYTAWDHKSGGCGHAHKNTTSAAKCARKTGQRFIVRGTWAAGLRMLQADCGSLIGFRSNLVYVWDVHAGRSTDRTGRIA